MSVRPAVLRRLIRELNQLRSEPPEGIRVSSPEDNMLDVTGIIEGPSGTPYEGGYFKVKFKFTEEYPSAPPKCWFASKIFHPNVSTAGEICVNTLKKDWQSSYGIGHILVTVKCLLIYPNPESALDEEAGKLLLENYDSYCERARLITKVHATPKVRPVEFDTPSTSTSSSSATTPSVETTTPPPPSTPPYAPISAARKSASPAPSFPATHPLQSSNALSAAGAAAAAVSASLSALNDKAPLGTADANTPAAPALGGSKAVKRPAGSNPGIGEKRKKALKRL